LSRVSAVIATLRRNDLVPCVLEHAGATASWNERPWETHGGAVITWKWRVCGFDE